MNPSYNNNRNIKNVSTCGVSCGGPALLHIGQENGELFLFCFTVKIHWILGQ